MSPTEKSGLFEATIRPAPSERTTSPILTAGRYVSMAIQPRCVGSQDSIRVRTSTSPSPSAGTSVSTKLKSLSWIAPYGRRASSHWRFFMPVLPRRMERSSYHMGVARDPHTIRRRELHDAGPAETQIGADRGFLLGVDWRP